MSKVLRKKITISSTCAISVYGGTFGPIRTPFYETIPNISRLICDGIEVYEETPNGKVRLTMANFDKFADEEDRIAKEKEAARIKAEEEQIRLAKAKAEQEEAAKVRALNEQRAREEQQQRNAQRNNKYNQKNNNNNQQQQQKPVVTDEIVEE